MGMDNLCDALACEGLFPKPPLYIIQNLSMSRVVLVQHVFQLEVRRPKSIAEMLGEDPTTV
jgi:hypothetical protein